MARLVVLGLVLDGLLLEGLAAGRSQVLQAPLAATPMAPDLPVEGYAALQRLLDELRVGSTPSVQLSALRGPRMSAAEFVPKCVEHVDELVHTIDQHYTDAQLEAVLTHDCQLTKEFPASRTSSFRSHEACLEFAKELTRCRMEELETGKTGQYEAYCQSYFEHLGGEGTTDRVPAEAHAVHKTAAPAPAAAKAPEPAGVKLPEGMGSWEWGGPADPRSWFGSGADERGAGAATSALLVLAAGTIGVNA